MMKNEALFAPSEKFMAPAKEFNKLALENTEKLVNMQIASMQSYTMLGLENWKSALEVTDVASLQEYAGKQREMAQVMTRKLAEDAKAVAELGNGYFAEARKIVQNGVSAVSPKAV